MVLVTGLLCFSFLLRGPIIPELSIGELLTIIFLVSFDLFFEVIYNVCFPCLQRIYYS